MPTSVLSLEDDRRQRVTCWRPLAGSHDQYRTEWAGTLHSAVAALIESDFDCVMVGLGLPEAEGLDVVEVLRDAAASAALIVLTDRDDASLGFRTIQGGVDGYLVKDDLASGDAAEVFVSVRYAVERARPKAELVLAEQSSRVLSAIVESTADAILTKSVDGIITTWNRGAERLYGYAASEVIGHRPRPVGPTAYGASHARSPIWTRRRGIAESRSACGHHPSTPRCVVRRTRRRSWPDVVIRGQGVTFAMERITVTFAVMTNG